MSDYRKLKDEECVRRGDVHTMLVDLPQNATMTDVIIRLHNIPAVEQPMSAVEYARALYEMSDTDLDGALTDWAVAYFSGDFEQAVAIVEKWAQEHPERSEE